LILLSLYREPLHGYAILKEVQALSEKRVILSTGTLYGALKRLLDSNWIARLDEASMETRVDGRGQKVYVLTEQGRAYPASRSRPPGRPGNESAPA
jgi:DNA-binding PadR family transcriptional regulator